MAIQRSGPAATIKHVAAQAGVAPSTVSRVLAGSPRISQATRDKVYAAMSLLNYHPNAIARSLAHRTSRSIGLVISRPAEQAFANPFFAEAIRGIGTVLQREGFHLVLSTFASPAEEREGTLDLVRQRRVDGVILTGPSLRDPLVDELQEMGFPFVLIGKVPGARGVSWVDNDNAAVAEIAVRHLLEKGHQRVAMISGPRHLVVCHDRVQGYTDTLAAAGLRLPRPYVRQGDFSREAGMRAMAELLDLPEPPTAVFCIDDAVALGALLHLRSQGIPTGPGGIALVGVNDDPLAELVGLTTVRIPMQDLGAQAARMLLDRVVRADGATHQVTLSCSLVVRQSSDWFLT